MSSQQFEACVSEDSPEGVWTQAAVSGLVGQRPTVDGVPGEVVAARKDRDGRVYVTIKADVSEGYQRHQHGES